MYCVIFVIFLKKVLFYILSIRVFALISSRTINKYSLAVMWNVCPLILQWGLNIWYSHLQIEPAINYYTTFTVCKNIVLTNFPCWVSAYHSNYLIVRNVLWLLIWSSCPHWFDWKLYKNYGLWSFITQWPCLIALLSLLTLSEFLISPSLSM